MCCFLTCETEVVMLFTTRSKAFIYAKPSHLQCAGGVSGSLHKLQTCTDKSIQSKSRDFDLQCTAQRSVGNRLIRHKKMIRVGVQSKDEKAEFSPESAIHMRKKFFSCRNQRHINKIVFLLLHFIKQCSKR